MAESLRDQLAANLDKLETETTQTPEPATDGTPDVAGDTSTPDATTAAPTEQKPGRTAGRARDENGRLLPGPAKKESAAEPGKAPPATTPTAQANQAAPAAETKPRPKYPTTWKKGFEQTWESLDPTILDEIVRRENDFAKGVSTYKAEWDSVRSLKEAVDPYRQILEQNRLDPAAHVSELLKAHHTLVMGSPQDKLELLARIVQQNQIPIERLFVQGQDGKVYFNQQLMQSAMAPRPQQTQQQQPQDVRAAVRDVLMAEKADMSIAEMKADGKTYPHFEQVRETMIGLLQSGLADDLKSAYQAALRHPRHADLFEADQKQVREQEETKKREEAKAAAARARAHTVSPRTETPTAGKAQSGAKGLRGQLEGNFDEVMASRV